MHTTLPLLAGMVSTTIFAGSVLPMLVKAVRSRDLSSYSLGNLGLANVGNVVHSVYVFSLPAGPLWVLHSFYLLSTALMLGWYLRWGRRGRALAQPSGREVAAHHQSGQLAGHGVGRPHHREPASRTSPWSPRTPW